MSVFLPAVEQWRPAATRAAVELARPGDVAPWPVGFTLATIQNESEGEAGKPGDNGTSLGLMQCKKNVLEAHNAAYPDRAVTWEQMKGTSTADAARQVRIGTWYQQAKARQFHRENARRFPWPAGPLTDDQILFSDLAYGAGGGALREHRAAARAAGRPDTWEGLKATPGPIPERKFWHAWRALRWTRRDEGQAPPAVAKVIPPSSSSSSGATWLPFLAVLVFVLMQPAKVPPADA